MPSLVQPSPGDVREELSAICAHKRFARSERLCQFLHYIVEQKLLGSNVNEQLVGVNVFGRQAGYDSANDTIVRTQAVELRKRLHDYYRDNPDARVRISVPKGNYNPTFTWVYQDAANPEASERLAFADVPDIAVPEPDQLGDESREPVFETPEKEAAVLPPAPLPERHRFALGWKIIIPAAIVAIALIAGVFLWLSRRATRLTGNHTVVLAEFTNTTGESVFDGTLKQALRIQLEQSPFLNVLSDAKVAATLRMMARPSNERLTEQVAQEICQRTNSQALLAGSIARVGNPYLLTLKAVNCQTGDTLVSTEAEVQNRDSMLKGLQQIGNQLRRKLGESLASLGKFNKPLDEATTSSLEALKTISDAMRMRTAGSFIDITPYFKRAIDLDPNFALAYAALGVYYANSDETKLAEVYLRKAFELRNRASERERFFIEGAYYEHISGDLGRSVQTYAQYAELYPLAVQPRDNLANVYLMTGIMKSPPPSHWKPFG